jgi:hypothetical protein
MPDLFRSYEEVRLDIDPGCRPDVVASMTDIPFLGRFDAVICEHALEHLYPHQVLGALRGFRRALDADGILFLSVPNLEYARPTEDVVYDSPAGPICGLDLYYGCSRMIADNPHMAHHCGFTPDLLRETLEAAEFSVVSMDTGTPYNLVAVARP